MAKLTTEELIEQFKELTPLSSPSSSRPLRRPST
jgi:hypothetical protein